MRLALCEAERAAEMGEVPVGAVVTLGDEILSVAHNLCHSRRDPTAHAELLAIRAAAERLGSEKLAGCTLYVTLEPCPMCTGAAMNARISRIVYAARDPRAGACGSFFQLPAHPFDTPVSAEEGPFCEESLSLLRAFFRERREKP